MELQFIQVNYPENVQYQHNQESDMRRHAARVAHRRLTDKTYNSPCRGHSLSQLQRSNRPRVSLNQKSLRKASEYDYKEEADEVPSEELIKRASSQILYIDDSDGKITPKWLPFWEQMISRGSKEFCQIFNCRDTVAPTDAPQWILHDCMIDWYTSSMLFFYQKLIDPKSATRKVVLEHRMKAFAALRRELDTNGPSDVALLMICGFTTMEKHFGTEENFRMHTNMLSRLIKERGGLNNVHEYVRACVLQYTISWLFDLQFLDPKSITCGPAMHYPRISATLLQRLPSGFQRLVEGGHISTDVLNVLIRITDAHLQKSKARTTDDDADENSLLNSPSNDQGLHPDPISACPIMSMPDEGDFIFQKALCQSLYHYVAWHIAPFSPLIRHTLVFRSVLSEKLPKIAESSKQAEERCLFWMWQIVIDSWWMSKTYMALPGQKLKEEQPRRFSKFYANGETEDILREFSWETKGD